MPHRLPAVTVFLLVATLATSAPRAEPPSGPRVRATSTEGKSLVGTLVEINDETMRLVQGRDGGEEVRLRRADVVKLEVSQQRSTRGKRIGLGLLVGAVIGGGIGAASETDCGPRPPENTLINLTSTLCHNMHGSSTAAGAVLGAAAGSLLGLAVSHGERWQVTPMDEVRLAAGWSRRGVGLSVSFAF